ncbi:MAG: hypothetical protein AAB325_17585 [Pseudomonadota bacterium]
MKIPDLTAPTTSNDSATEDKFYEQALTEIETGQTIKAIWARSLASAEGDEAKTKALYIRDRVKALIGFAERATLGSEGTAGVRGRDEAESRASTTPQASSKPRNGLTIREKVLIILTGIFAVLVLSFGLIHSFFTDPGGNGKSDAPHKDITAVPAPSSAAVPQEKQEKDATVAPDKVDFYRNGAAQGDPTMQLILGLRYKEGQGVAKDFMQAAFWWEKAAAQGKESALMALYSLYAEGEATDYVQAHKWALIAAANGMNPRNWVAGAEPRLMVGWVEKKMTQEQIAEAQRRASEWLKAQPPIKSQKTLAPREMPKSPLATPSRMVQSRLPPCPASYNSALWTSCVGEETFPSGAKVVGEFKDGKLNGQGTESFPDGQKYVGQYRDGKRNGQGTLTYGNGATYIGGFKDDKYDGQGNLKFPDGTTYIGEHRDGRKNGQGTVTFPSGEKFAGDYRDGKANGQGTQFSADGSVLRSGIWENGVFVGGR